MKASWNRTYFWIIIEYYENVDEANQTFSDTKEYYSPIIACELDMGDECFMAKSNGASLPSVMEV